MHQRLALKLTEEIQRLQEAVAAEKKV